MQNILSFLIMKNVYAQGNTQNHLADTHVPLRFDMVSGFFFLYALEKKV